MLEPHQRIHGGLNYGTDIRRNPQEGRRGA
jgi:hypothetical protein